MATGTKKEKESIPTQEKKKYTIKDLAEAQKAIDAAVNTKDKLEKCYELLNTYKRLVEQLTLSLESKIVESDIDAIKEKFTHLQIDTVEIGREEYKDNSVLLKLAGMDKPGIHDSVVQLKKAGNKNLRVLIYNPQRDFTGKQIDQTESHGAEETKKKEDKKTLI